MDVGNDPIVQLTPPHNGESGDEPQANGDEGVEAEEEEPRPLVKEGGSDETGSIHEKEDLEADPTPQQHDAGAVMKAIHLYIALSK